MNCCNLTGSAPATAFLKQSGVHIDSKGFIPVNKVLRINVVMPQQTLFSNFLHNFMLFITKCMYDTLSLSVATHRIGLHFCTQTLQTNVEGVFAGGDIVTFPLSLRNNKKVNIPHWQMAHVHGKTCLDCLLLCPNS